MNSELILGVLETAASLAGLSLHQRDVVRRFALITVVILGGWTVQKAISSRRELLEIESRIIDAANATQVSADQLYESLSATNITRSTFDNALNAVVQKARLSHRMLEFRTADGTPIRVRVYSASS
jgi:hypothetical protein